MAKNIKVVMENQTSNWDITIQKRRYTFMYFEVCSNSRFVISKYKQRKFPYYRDVLLWENGVCLLVCLEMLRYWISRQLQKNSNPANQTKTSIEYIQT